MRPIADGMLGVPGRPNVGEETRFPDEPARMEPGRARRDGDRPFRGRGEEDRCGRPEPLYFRWMRVKEKMACEREDCAFISVSFVRRIDVP